MLSVPAASPARAKKLIFVVTEDWFFCSHFLPMAKVALGLGLDVAVVTRVSQHRQTIETAGVRILPFDDDRGAHGVRAILRFVARLRGIFQRERPDLVHLIALKPAVLGGLAARLAGIDRRIYALTGQGFLAADVSAKNRLVLASLRTVLRWVLDGPKVRYLFENEDDPAILAPHIDPSRISILGGAGIDPQEFIPQPFPPMPPLRIAIVARMLWQKGIDLAVAATAAARARGAPVELSLYGAPDPANPRSISREQLLAWSGEPGVKWYGATGDVAEVWARHHVCCLPSRGGEGLPRSLLEAAACGRPIVTTDVAGCRTFVRHSLDGLVVPPSDTERLADAFVTLAGAPALVAAMGGSARKRVMEGFSSDHVSSAVGAVYADLLAR